MVCSWKRPVLGALLLLQLLLCASATSLHAGEQLSISELRLRRSGPVRHDKVPASHVRHDKLPASDMADQQSTRPTTSVTANLISLVVQYFVVHTTLALLKAVDSRGPLLRTFQTAVYTVGFAPMLGVLFIATRMRALQLQQGGGSLEWWVDAGMYCATYALLGTTVFVLVLAGATNGNVDASEDGSVKVDKRTLGRSTSGGSTGVMLVLCHVVKALLMLTLYGGTTAVCVGVIIMEAPAGLWGPNGPPVSPAVTCTIILVALYFATYLTLAIVRSYSQLSHPHQPSVWENVLKVTVFYTSMAPMLAILFITARLRALQMDPVAGNPQPWAQFCFYMCTYGLCALAVLVLIASKLGSNPQMGRGGGDLEFEVKNHSMGAVLSGLRQLALIAIYVGFTMVVVSVFTLEHPDGADKTPPVAPTTQCVLMMTTLYFASLLVLVIALTLKELVTGDQEHAVHVMHATLQSAHMTVFVCPMLCVLFLATRMRAHQMGGVPQYWAQTFMYIATGSIFLHYTLVLLLGFVTRTAPVTDQQGNVNPAVTEKGSTSTVVTALRLFVLAATHVAVVAVIVSIYTITPATAVGWEGI